MIWKFCFIFLLKKQLINIIIQLYFKSKFYNSYWFPYTLYTLIALFTSILCWTTCHSGSMLLLSLK